MGETTEGLRVENHAVYGREWRYLCLTSHTSLVFRMNLNCFLEQEAKITGQHDRHNEDL